MSGVRGHDGDLKTEPTKNQIKNSCVKMQKEQNTLINKKIVPHLIMRKIRSDKSALAAWRQQQAAASKKMKNK